MFNDGISKVGIYIINDSKDEKVDNKKGRGFGNKSPF